MFIHSLCYWCSILAKGKVQPLLLVFPIGQRETYSLCFLVSCTIWSIGEMSVHSLCYWWSLLAKGKVQPLFCCQLYYLLYRENVCTQPLLLVFYTGQRETYSLCFLVSCTICSIGKMSVHSLCYWCSILAKGKVQPLFCC